MKRDYPCWNILRPSNYNEPDNKAPKRKVTVLSPDSGKPRDYYVETYLQKVRGVYDMEKRVAIVDIPRDVYENNDFKEAFIKELRAIDLSISNLTYLSTVVSVTVTGLQD